MISRENFDEILRQNHELELKVRSLAMAQQIAKVGSWDWNLADNTLTWSDETYRQHGLEPNELEPSFEIFSRFIHPDDFATVKENVQHALDDNLPYSIEARMRRKDGSQWLMHAQGTVYRDADGKPERFIGTQRDITDIRQTEDKLNLQAEIINKLSEGICLVQEKEGLIIQTNPQFDAMFGYGKDEIIGKHVAILNAPSDKDPRERAEEILAAINEKDGRWQGEVHNIRKDGTIFWSLASISRMQHREYGNVSISILTDITARKKDEEALRLHGEIMNNMAEGVYLIRAADATIVFANEKFENMFGYDHGEMIGQHVSIVNAPTEISPEETAQTIMASLKEKGSWQGEVNNIKKDGTTFWCHASVSRFIHPRYSEVLISIHTDISERKQAEEALRESEIRNRMILSKSIDGFFASDMEGRFLDANEAYSNMVGYSRDELLKMTIADVEGIESAEEIQNHIKTLIHTGNERFESKHRHRKGHLVDIEISVNYDPSLGLPFFAFVRDIAARKKTETILKENEERLRLIFESSMDAIYQMDTNGRFTFINRAGAEMFGYTPEEIKNRHFSLLVSKDALAEGEKAVRATLAGENTQGEIFVRQRHGYEFPVSYRMAPIQKEDSIVGITGIASDITDRRKEEEKRLRESLTEKESLLKEIHHRVKNNMQIVSSLLSLQSMRSTIPEVHSAIKDSQNRVKTMGLIHEKLYKTENLSKIEFSDYIKTLTEYLASTYDSASRQIKIEINAENIFLSADTAIPCGLIINELVTNSFKYAFPDRTAGLIRIDMTRNAENRISLTISDNGRGLPPDFDIEKTDTLGTNLVRNLARQLEATITFNNEHGTMCRIEFTGN